MDNARTQNLRLLAVDCVCWLSSSSLHTLLILHFSSLTRRDRVRLVFAPSSNRVAPLRPTLVLERRVKRRYASHLFTTEQPGARYLYSLTQESHCYGGDLWTKWKASVEYRDGDADVTYTDSTPAAGWASIRAMRWMPLASVDLS